MFSRRVLPEHSWRLFSLPPLPKALGVSPIDNNDDEYDDDDDEPAHPPAPAQHSVALSSQQFEQTQRPRAGNKNFLSVIF